MLKTNFSETKKVGRFSNLEVKNFIKRIIDTQESVIILALILMCLVIGTVNKAFWSFDNLMNICRSSSYIAIVAIANTLVLVMAGLDLSVGSVIGLGGLVTAVLMHDLGIPILPSIILGIIPGLLFGLFNGFAIVKLKIPSMIVTLGTMFIARGVVYVITKGAPVYPLPENFNKIGNGNLFGIPYSVIIALIMALIAGYILKNTAFGRYIYAIGGNAETARLSGIKVQKVQMVVYAISAIAASISGIIITSRVASAQVSTGQGYEMNVIASVIIGGTSMFGGVGTIKGTVIGALIMSVLQNGMILMSVSPYWQNIVIGSIMIATVGFDQYRRNRKTKG